MKRMSRFLYDTWYGASVVHLTALVAGSGFCAADFKFGYAAPAWISCCSTVLVIVAMLSLLNVFVSSVVSLVRRRFALAAGQFAMLIGCLLVYVVASTMLTVYSMFGVSEDHFADNLKIPKDVAYRTPGDLERAPRGVIERDDAYSLALTAAATNALSSCGKIRCDISDLDGLYRKNPGLVRRYWASHPGWRLVNDKARGLSARRKSRWRGHWLAGHDSGWTVECGPAGGENWRSHMSSTCQVLMRDVEWEGIKCRSGDEVRISLKKEVDSMKRGRVLCMGDALTLSVDEASGFTASRVIQPTFDFTREEFSALAEAGEDWAAIAKTLPRDAVRKGAAELSVFKGFQGGLYTYEAWVNPGEEGETYLKAFEVTKGTRLSAQRLEEATREYVGWNDDPDDKFLVSSDFTIYEGDWEKFYAARIEVWFVSAKDGTERKLLEGVYKVDGWQR